MSFLKEWHNASNILETKHCSILINNNKQVNVPITHLWHEKVLWEFQAIKYLPYVNALCIEQTFISLPALCSVFHWLSASTEAFFLKCQSGAHILAKSIPNYFIYSFSYSNTRVCFSMVQNQSPLLTNCLGIDYPLIGLEEPSVWPL